MPDEKRLNGSLLFLPVSFVENVQSQRAGASRLQVGTHRLTSVCYTVCSNTLQPPHTTSHQGRLSAEPPAHSCPPGQSPPPVPGPPPGSHHTASFHSGFPGSSAHTLPPPRLTPSAQTTVPPSSPSPHKTAYTLLGAHSSHQGALLPPAPHHSIFPDLPEWVNTRKSTPPPVLRQLQTSICESLPSSSGVWAPGREGLGLQHKALDT